MRFRTGLCEILPYHWREVLGEERKSQGLTRYLLAPFAVVFELVGTWSRLHRKLVLNLTDMIISDDQTRAPNKT